MTTTYKFYFDSDTINDHIGTTYKEKVSFISQNCEYFDSDDFNALLEDFVLQVKHKEELQQSLEELRVHPMHYIDFEAICHDHDLNHGDISPDQLSILESILTEFVKQNKY